MLNTITASQKEEYPGRLCKLTSPLSPRPWIFFPFHGFFPEIGKNIGSVLLPVVAGLRGATSDACPSPQLSPISYFHAVFSKNCQIIDWCPSLGNPASATAWIRYWSMFYLQWCRTVTGCHCYGRIYGPTLDLDECRKFDRRSHPGVAAGPCDHCLCAGVSNYWTCDDKGTYYCAYSLRACVIFFLKKLWFGDEEYSDRH